MRVHCPPVGLAVVYRVYQDLKKGCADATLGEFLCTPKNCALAECLEFSLSRDFEISEISRDFLLDSGGFNWGGFTCGGFNQD